MIQPARLRGRDKPQGPVGLRRDAEKIAGALPPLLAEAEVLAATVSMGVHGRRRAGHGENFWQYRQAVPGDPRSMVDWRRSGRSDMQFIREMEWEAAQTVSLWVDESQAMDYRAPDSPRSKGERGALLALALSVLLIKAGERVALMGTTAAQPRGGRAVFFSDFLGDPDTLMPALAHAADQGVKGCFVQILDETEELFPFDGRVIFESMGGMTDFETQRARALREAYVARLAERRARLLELTRHLGWRCLFHHTSTGPRAALLWLYMAVGQQRS